MKLLVDSRKFYDSIANAEDREKFKDYFFKGFRTFSNTPVLRIDLAEAKTMRQLGTIWRDFGIIARLLFTHSETVYAMTMKAEPLRDFFLTEDEWGIGKKRKKTWRLRTLSEFSKQDCVEFIPLMRDYWQGIINKEYGEYVIIHWSRSENIEKPDYEFVRKS